MPSYKVYVTASLDDDFDVDAANPTEAMKLAEEEFKRTYQQMWSGVDATSYEVLSDETELDDGY